MTEWVDITDGQNTKIFKRIALVKFILKMAVIVFFVIEAVAIATTVSLIAPYVNDAELVMEHTWTNSQITALIEMLVLCGVLLILSKMMKKVF